MKKFTCPYCYAEHTIYDCDLKCSYQHPGKAGSCKSDIKKTDKGLVADVKNYKKCMKCTDARKTILCKEVGKEIPSVCMNGKSLPISLVGAKYSGKSIYIGVLINEIRRKMTREFNCSLDICCSEESQRFYNDNYYTPLYDRHKVPYATHAGDVTPMIFPLRFMSPSNKIKNVSTLTFYDTSGENLDNNDSILIYNKYIPNSKGIIFLLDPLQVPSIRKKLEGKIDLPPKNTDAAEILNRVIVNIKNIKNIKGLIKIPIALVFTKMDVLEKFDILPEGSFLKNESEHLERGAFVISDFENTNIEIKTILENYMDEEIPQMMRNFSKYSFFGISSLGDAPLRDNLAGSEPHPKRVLDPLLWLLAENKFIPKIKR